MSEIETGCDQFLIQKIEQLTALVRVLKDTPSLEEKIALLKEDLRIRNFHREGLDTLLCRAQRRGVKGALVLHSIIAIGQASGELDLISLSIPQLLALIDDLWPVELFYKEMGGIVGYHLVMLQQLALEERGGETEVVYHHPEGVALFEIDETLLENIDAGIEALPSLAEIYPVGGAADRLQLWDEKTQLPLPAARLQFCGKTLLEWMINDLQAREFLYYQQHGQQVTVPIAMMTSSEKGNDGHIRTLCEENQWFGRSPDSFFLFCQPLVPVVDRQGQWGILSPGKLLLKPGGHGVIWKLAQDQGVFEALKSLGKKKLVIRQINNPIAGCDYGLLAFTGVGYRQEKFFGFASCPRRVHAAEGMNVLIERKGLNPKYCLTNVEYCDFTRLGIEDVPESSGSPYSQFPSNTNLLFADIQALEGAIQQMPLPGMIVNFKKMVLQNPLGCKREVEMARLESTMQNIADAFTADDTFLTYNHRHKTISAIKREWDGETNSSGEALETRLLETPEGCYWDLYRNAQDLLKNYCGFSLPPLPSIEEYIQQGPHYQFFYHPSLGPLYTLIAKKLKGGQIKEGSFLQLEIAHFECEQLHLEGALLVRALCPMGHLDAAGRLCYSDRGGRCRLKNVCVLNQGGGRIVPSRCWKEDIEAHIRCEIILHEGSLFEAEDVTFEGPLKVEVPPGQHRVAIQRGNQVEFFDI